MFIELIRNGLVLALLVFLAIFFLRKHQHTKLNWSIAFGALYVLVLLPIINYCCVKLGLWHFTEFNDTAIHLPYDIYFIWFVIWGVLPFLIFRGRYVLIIAIALFWIDILFMPLLETANILVLNKYWYLGDLALVVFVFIPAYFWSKSFYLKRNLELRTFFQVLIMALVFLICIPFILNIYIPTTNISGQIVPFLIQFFIIIIFPALVAVNDLVYKGLGTPFPYDRTKKIVNTGVYAYCRNPIQWSFTFMFIPLSIYYNSLFLLLGVLVSICYAFAISDYQEYADLEKRFGTQWLLYKKNTPKWFFQWKVKNYPRGIVYFDSKCGQCNQLSQWFQERDTINLNIENANTFTGNQLLQVTYIDVQGRKYESVAAIAHCLEHINLAYASLGWFMRFPGINYVLQAIVNTMEFRVHRENL